MSLIEALIKKRTCLAIMGPTASGKSQLSMALAERLPVEIISVDSALIYREMDIGTAKPTKSELAQVPHHLINSHDVTESYSASEFVDDVKRLVEEIFERGRLPMLVGGTMMYFNALQKGMSDLPSANAQVREKWQKLWDESPELLHERLSDVDPESAARIHKNDPQRLIRALEVYDLTGKTLTEFRHQPKQGLPSFNILKIALIPEDRALLHKQIEKRFIEMVEAGFIKEVQQLLEEHDLDVEMTSMRSVGYRQAWMFLEGDYDYDTFIDKAVVATRQLAKRQLTWLRKEEGVEVIDPYKTSLVERIDKSLALLLRQVDASI